MKPSSSAPLPTGKSARPPDFLLPLLIALLSLIWGSTFFVIREGLQDLPPLTSAAVRFGLASAVMALLCSALSAKEGGGRPPWHLVLILGLGNFGLCYGLVYWAEMTLSSGLVSVLWATFPLSSALIGNIGPRSESLTAAQWGGFLVALAGMGLLFATDLRGLGRESVTTAGILLLSPTIAAFGQIWAKRHSTEVSSLRLNRDAMLLGCVVLCLWSLGVEDFRDARWTPRAVGSVLYLALIGTVVTFGLYYWALRWWPSSRLTVIAYLSPAVALALGAAAGGEVVGTGTLAGAVAILGGVALVLRRPGRPPREAASSESANRTSESPGR